MEIQHIVNSALLNKQFNQMEVNRALYHKRISREFANDLGIPEEDDTEERLKRNPTSLKAAEKNK